MNTSFLEDALDFCSQKERYHVAGALYCHLHNTAQELAGNTADNDVQWIARELYRDFKSRRPGIEDIAQATPEERSQWEDIARVCLRIMPHLQQRIASRLIELSKVMADIECAERAAYKTLEGTTENTDNHRRD